MLLNTLGGVASLPQKPVGHKPAGIVPEISKYLMSSKDLWGDSFQHGEHGQAEKKCGT